MCKYSQYKLTHGYVRVGDVNHHRRCIHCSSLRSSPAAQRPVNTTVRPLTCMRPPHLLMHDHDHYRLTMLSLSLPLRTGNRKLSEKHINPGPKFEATGLKTYIVVYEFCCRCCLNNIFCPVLYCPVLTLPPTVHSISTY